MSKKKRNEKQRAHRREHRDEYLEKERKYRETHREEIRERQRKVYCMNHCLITTVSLSGLMRLEKPHMHATVQRMGRD